jgi:hypothetical protein
MMQKGIGKMGCFFNKKRMNRQYYNTLNDTSSNNSGIGLNFVRLYPVIISVVMFISAGPAFSQFVVQPMTKEIQVIAGKTYQTELTIYNLDPNTVSKVNIKVVELGQNQDGSWRIIDTDPSSVDYDPTVDISKLSSCRAWIKLKTNTASINPNDRAVVNIDVKVPAHKNGFYFAGVLVYPPPDMSISGIELMVRFFVPFIIQVEGRTLTAKVEMIGLGLEYVPPSETGPSSANVLALVQNVGTSYARVKPYTRVWRFQNERWQVVRTKEFDAIKIIPGATVSMKTDLMRSLPTGQYKVACGLYVDNMRPSASAIRIFDFVGDPTITRAPTEAPLDFNPQDIGLEKNNSIVKSATRTIPLNIHNASEEKIDIKFGGFKIPDVIKGKVIMDTGVKGDDIDGSGWLKMDPPEFTLNGYSDKNISIVVQVPNSGITQPCYYGALTLISTYPDGKQAGVSTLNVCLNNQNVEAVPVIQTTNLSIHEQDPAASSYIILAEFTNKGQMYFDTQKCRAAVVKTDGVMLSGTTLNSDKSGVILPFEKRLYSGIIDISNVPVGTYIVEVNLEDNQKHIERKQMMIQIVTSGKGRVVNVIRTINEVRDLIKVDW